MSSAAVRASYDRLASASPLTRSTGAVVLLQQASASARRYRIGLTRRWRGARPGAGNELRPVGEQPRILRAQVAGELRDRAVAALTRWLTELIEPSRVTGRRLLRGGTRQPESLHVDQPGQAPRANAGVDLRHVRSHAVPDDAGRHIRNQHIQQRLE